MRGFRHWRWHLDEMYVKLNGEMVYLWRAVDHEGEVLESYVTRTRDKAAALTCPAQADVSVYANPVSLIFYNQPLFAKAARLSSSTDTARHQQQRPLPQRGGAAPSSGDDNVADQINGLPPVTAIVAPEM
jgi:transposase-like protein